jgi:hydrogenase maturation protease
MNDAAAKILVYGYGNPGRGDDGLGPALAAAVEALAMPGIEVDANYQLTVEDAAAMNRFGTVVFADAASAGPAPFWFSRIDDSGTGRLGWTSHSVTPVQVMALARDLFGSRVPAYTLGIRGYAFGELDEDLSRQARTNLASALAFVRKMSAERRFEQYVQEFGHFAAGQLPAAQPGRHNP